MNAFTHDIQKIAYALLRLESETEKGLHGEEAKRHLRDVSHLREIAHGVLNRSEGKG